VMHERYCSRRVFTARVTVASVRQLCGVPRQGFATKHHKFLVFHFDVKVAKLVSMFSVNEKMFSTFGAENLCVGQAGVVLLE